MKHQEKLKELQYEIQGLDSRSSQYSSVVTKTRKEGEESSLPEDERSEIESELECPVCLGKIMNKS